MLLRTFTAAALVLAAASAAAAQTANSNQTTAPAAGRTSTPATRRAPAVAPPAAQEGAQEGTPTPSTRGRRAGAAPAGSAAATAAVRDAFDTLIDGIRRADAGAVMGVYWNSPRLMLFNNNGTVTRGWEQVRSNRESLYARVREVKLDVRDVNVQLLGPTAAVVTCLWEQSQTADGQPERATGRLTLVFQKVGTKWSAVHAHTSPDRPDPSRLLPSERTPDPDAGTARPPARP
jgi:uncharacterized protein (TIGR02246 family)